MSARAEKVAEMQRLRAQGMTLREVAGRMQTTPATVSNYLYGPDGSKIGARKSARFHEGRWPYTRVLQMTFGSWSAAIEAAGYKAAQPGEGKS